MVLVSGPPPQRVGRRFASRHAAAGFTVLELILVIVILGILFAVVMPRLEGISPTYRLRSAAREVGSHINWVRSTAGGTGDTYAIYYNIDEGTYQAVLPPGPDDDPDLPFEDREHLAQFELPDQIVFSEIILADGTSYSNGDHYVPIDTFGNQGSHIVNLKNVEDRILAVKFNSLLGIVDFFGEAVRFEEYR